MKKEQEYLMNCGLSEKESKKLCDLFLEELGLTEKTFYEVIDDVRNYDTKVRALRVNRNNFCKLLDEEKFSRKTICKFLGISKQRLSYILNEGD